MILNEFLVKLGTIAETDKVKKFGDSLKTVASVSAAAVAGLNAAAGVTAAFIDSNIRKTHELASARGGLYQITQKEIAVSNRYIASTKKLSLNLDLMKNKIALGVAPQLISITEKTNQFLQANKQLISAGLQKVIGWLFKFVEGTAGVIKSIAQFIDKTVGFKNALILAIGFLGIFKAAAIRAFLANPVTWFAAAIFGVILLIDDLMTYMRGGESKFGSMWDKWIDKAKEVKKWWAELSDSTKGFIKNTGKVVGALAALMMFVPGVGKAFSVSFGLAGKAVMGLGSVMLSNPILATIAAIAASVFLIYKNWDGITEWFGNLWDGISADAKIAWDALIGFVDITPQIMDSWGKIKGFFADLWDDVGVIFDKAIGKLLGMIDKVKAPFDKVGEWLGDGVDSVRDGAKNVSSWFGSGTTNFAAPSPNNSVVSNSRSQTIQGGDTKVDITVSDTNTAQAIKREVESINTRAAYDNLQMANR